MTNKIVKNTTLFFCFLALLVTSACNEDNCSGIANSPPPFEMITIQFIDQEDNEVLLEASSIEINSSDKKEKIDYGSTFFKGFAIGKKNPIVSNTVDIFFKNEKILVLEYTKQKTSTECNGNLYLLQHRGIRSLSKNYIVENQREDAIDDPIRIRVLP